MCLLPFTYFIHTHTHPDHLFHTKHQIQQNNKINNNYPTITTLRYQTLSTLLLYTSYILNVIRLRVVAPPDQSIEVSLTLVHFVLFWFCWRLVFVCLFVRPSRLFVYPFVRHVCLSVRSSVNVCPRCSIISVSVYDPPVQCVYLCLVCNIVSTLHTFFSFHYDLFVRRTW